MPDGSRRAAEDVRESDVAEPSLFFMTVVMSKPTALSGGVKRQIFLQIQSFGAGKWQHAPPGVITHVGSACPVMRQQFEIRAKRRLARVHKSVDSDLLLAANTGLRPEFSRQHFFDLFKSKVSEYNGA
jgi:hypothetical protein